MANRDKLIDEIISTERDYIKDLEIIIEVFYYPLKEMGIISEEEQKTLFGNITELLPVNRDNVLVLFEQAYQQAIDEGIDSADIELGSAFLQLADSLKSYTDYCSNQPYAMALLETLQFENNSFQAFMMDLMTNDARVRGLSLNSFIIKPIQRLCKYPLLLRELLRMTDESKEEYKNLIEAQDKVNVTVEYVNNMQRKAETENEILLQLVEGIGNSIEGAEELALASDKNRKLIEYGEIYETAGEKKRQVRKIWLFSNLVVLAVPLKRPKRRNGYRIDSRLESYYHIRDIKVVDTSDTESFSNLFMLGNRIDEYDQMLQLSCPTLQSKQYWIKEIKMLKQIYQKQEVYRLKFEQSQVNNPKQGDPEEISDITLNTEASDTSTENTGGSSSNTLATTESSPNTTDSEPTPTYAEKRMSTWIGTQSRTRISSTSGISLSSGRTAFLGEIRTRGLTTNINTNVTNSRN